MTNAMTTETLRSNVAAAQAACDRARAALDAATAAVEAVLSQDPSLKAAAMTADAATAANLHPAIGLEMRRQAAYIAAVDRLMAARRAARPQLSLSL